jgi:hypothetical protein
MNPPFRGRIFARDFVQKPAIQRKGGRKCRIRVPAPMQSSAMKKAAD